MRADRHLEKYMTVTESKGNQKKKMTQRVETSLMTLTPLSLTLLTDLSAQKANWGAWRTFSRLP